MTAKTAKVTARATAANDLVWLRRCQAGDTIDIACLRLGPARILHMPGELFVMRNVANLVCEGDFNLLAALQYAVEVLKVKHIIVCGHYNCGGVKHAMGQQGFGPVNKWLAPLKELYLLHKDEIESISDPQGRWDRLVEINVTEQVNNLAKTDIIQRAWLHERRPMLHGWIYNLRTGHLNELALMHADLQPQRSLAV